MTLVLWNSQIVSRPPKNGSGGEVPWEKVPRRGGLGLRSEITLPDNVGIERLNTTEGGRMIIAPNAKSPLFSRLC